MTETYKISQEMVSIIEESIALNDLKDKYIDKRFGFNKAKKLAIKVQKLKTAFWHEVTILYPEIDTGHLVYTPGENVVRIKGTEKIKEKHD